MITTNEFLKTENIDEIFSLVDEFWIRAYKKDFIEVIKGIPVITDKNKMKIVKEMIKITEVKNK